MADLENLQDAVFDAIQLSLGLSDIQANKMLRYSMPNGESVAFEELKPDDNRCYIRLSNSTLGGVGTRNKQYMNIKNVTNDVTKTLQIVDGLNVNLVFYGANAVENAEKVFAMIMEEKAVEKLIKANLAVVGRGALPVQLPELVNGKWLTRCDLEIRMYRLLEYVEVVKAMDRVPKIEIIRG